METRKYSREYAINTFDLLRNDNIGYKLDEMGYFDAPASTKYHGAYEGGLNDHNIEVTKALINLTKDLYLEWQRKESPVIVGMFHDLCKVDKYVKVDGKYEYVQKELLSGHGDKSVMIASTLIKLTEEEMLCIRYHMGAYESKDWDGYDKAIRKYPNVLFTHTADMIASKIKNI